MTGSKRILITNGRLWSILAITRVFARLGYQVDIVDSSKKSALARYSKYCKNFYCSPSLTDSPDKFCQFVLDLVKKNKYAFIVPVFEEVFALSKIKEELSKYSRLLINDFDTYMCLHNKSRLNQFCLENNISTPKTIKLLGDQAIENASESFNSFPLFLKMPISCASAGVQKISSKEQLNELLDQIKDMNFDPDVAPILQQGIVGYQIATQAVYRDGKLLSFHMYKNIAEYPVKSGSGVIRESVFHPEIQKLLVRIGEKLDYQGFLGLDFLVDTQNSSGNDVYLIDANPRVPLGFYNSHLAGASLIKAYINGIDDVENHVELSTSYKMGVKTRSNIGHVMWLLSVFFNSSKTPLNIFRIYKKYRKDKLNSSPEIFDSKDLTPSLVVPLIFLSVLFTKGDSLMNKYLNGSIFTEETFRFMNCHK